MPPDPAPLPTPASNPPSGNTGSGSAAVNTPISRLTLPRTSSDLSSITTPTHQQVEDEGEDEEFGDGKESDEDGDAASDFAFPPADSDPVALERRNTQKDAIPKEFYAYKDGACVQDSTNFPKPPKDYKRAKENTEAGEIEFSRVDNPGEWSDFIFRPKFDKSKKYLYHCQPSGIKPVPSGIRHQPIREYMGWKFFYKGWFGESGAKEGGEEASQNDSQTQELQTQEEDILMPQQQSETTEYHRKFSTRDNLFPEERKGSLNVERLRAHGLTDKRMSGKDALFFYQLLLPLHRNDKTGIPGDARVSYYPEVFKHTNTYISRGNDGYGSSGSHFRHPSEHVKFDGILFMHGALGGKGNIANRWITTDCAYSPEIAACSSMSYSRWCRLKRNLKLCDNETEAKLEAHGMGNPANKFDLIYKCIVDNVRYFTKRSCLDIVIDESTWPYYGFGGAYVDYLRDKMCSRGGQTVLLMDQDRIRPRGWLHRSKRYKKTDSFTSRGQSEVHDLINSFVLPYIGEQKLWSIPPHLTADNFFTGDAIFNWMGEKGLGMIGTVAKNRYPSGVEHKYFHKESANGSKQKSIARVARVAHPVTLVKDVPATATTKAYRRVHCTFQSTGPCNIGSVNSIPSCSFYFEERTRGRGEKKRSWGIEMNESRELYLNSYGKIDQTDSYISKAQIKYRSWKYYHAALNHAKALAIVTAHDMYLECCEGELDPAWKVEKPMSFYEFHQTLAKQMLEWDPVESVYPGDEKLRETTQTSTKSRKRKRNKKATRPGVMLTFDESLSPVPYYGPPLDKITINRNNRRLCLDVHEFTPHSRYRFCDREHGRQCFVCGDRTYTYCGLCKDPTNENGERPWVPLCTEKKVGRGNKRIRKDCFSQWHDPDYFGLGKFDQTVVMGNNKKDFKWPVDQQTWSNNSKYMREHLGMPMCVPCRDLPPPPPRSVVTATYSVTENDGTTSSVRSTGGGGSTRGGATEGAVATRTRQHGAVATRTRQRAKPPKKKNK